MSKKSFTPVYIEKTADDHRNYHHQPASKALNMLDNGTLGNSKVQPYLVWDANGQLSFEEGMNTLLYEEGKKKIQISFEPIKGKMRGTIIRTRDIALAKINDYPQRDEKGNLTAVVTLQELVDKNIYKSLDSARKHATQLVDGMSKARIGIYAADENISLEGVPQLFSGCFLAKVDNNEKALYFVLNNLIDTKALFTMYVKTPDWIDKLESTNAYCLFKYICQNARINQSTLAKKEFLTLSFTAIIEHLNISDPTGKNPKEKILAPLLEVIEEIKKTAKEYDTGEYKRFSIEAKYNKNWKTTEIISKGYIKFTMPYEILTDYMDKIDKEEKYRENVSIKADAIKRITSKKKETKPAAAPKNEDRQLKIEKLLP